MFAWLTVFVITGQPQFDLTVFRSTLTVQALHVAFIAGYAGYLAAYRRLPGPTSLDWPITALVIVYAAAIATSIYPRVSLEASLLVLVALIAFYAFHDFPFLTPAVVVRGLAAAGAIAAADALWHVFRHYLEWRELTAAADAGSALLPPAIPRVDGVGDNVNALAMAINLTLPFALAVAVAPERRYERAAGIIASGLILAALFFTLSRGAWLGTFAALFVFAALYAARGLDLGRLRGRIPVGRLLVAAAVLFVVVAIGAVAVSQWESRPESIFRPSLGPRYDALEVGIEIFRDRPLLGSGPYTYPLLYSVYSGEYPVENIHPHNGYVNILVDIGIIGGAVALAGGIVVGRRMVAAYAAPQPRLRVIAAACAASLASLAVHSLADSPNPWSTAVLPLAAVLALSVRLHGRPLATRLSLPTAPRLLPAVLPVLLLALWLRFDVPHSRFDSSIRHLAAAEFSEAADDAGDAASADDASAAYHLNRGVTLAILHLVTAEQRPIGPALLEDAEAAFERAVSLEPRGGIGHANLALTRLLLNDRQGAVDAARAAAGRAPGDGAVSAAAGAVLEWAGERDEAAAAYAIAVERDPSLVQAPFWSLNAARLPLRQQAIDASGLTACQVGRGGALYAGFTDDLDRLTASCRELVDRDTSDALARADLAVMLTALGRDAEALQEAERAAAQVPDNAFVRTSLAIALFSTGDLGRVRGELVRATHLGTDPDAPLLLAYTYDPPPAPTSPVLRRVAAIAESKPVPSVIVSRLRETLPRAAPMVFDDGIQRYALGVLYYRARFFRESPTSIMVPGDWLNLASPRVLLIQQLLESVNKP